MDVVFCGAGSSVGFAVGLAVGFVVCICSGSFDIRVELIGVCFVELCTLVAFGVVLCTVVGRDLVGKVLVTVFKVIV